MALKSAVRLSAVLVGVTATVSTGALVSPSAAAGPASIAVSSAVGSSATQSPAATAVVRAKQNRKVKFTRGYRTAKKDNGRPVKLIAGALGVSAKVFRDAFSKVTPTPDGSDPDPSQAQANKQILLDALGPYGVTNERLDEVSDYYRYFGTDGAQWPRTKAKARVKIRNGKVVRITIKKAGSGYSATPKVTVRGYPNVKVKAKVAYGTDFSANGQIVRLKVVGT